MSDELRFDTANNASMSFHILAERIRTGDAKMILAQVRDGSVLEVKVSGQFTVKGTAGEISVSPSRRKDRQNETL